jgi:hypothetical protein
VFHGDERVRRRCYATNLDYQRLIAIRHTFRHAQLQLVQPYVLGDRRRTKCRRGSGLRHQRNHNRSRYLRLSAGQYARRERQIGCAKTGGD